MFGKKASAGKHTIPERRGGGAWKGKTAVKLGGRGEGGGSTTVE